MTRRFVLALSMGLASSVALSGSVGCSHPTGGAKVVESQKIAADERTPQKLVDRGKGFYEVGDLTRAEQYFAAAIAAGASEKEVLPLLLRVCVEAKRYRVAIGYAEPVLQKHPDDFHLRELVASLYAAVDEYPAAREQLEVVLAKHPDEASAHYALAIILRDEMHLLLDADAHFREYLRIAPTGPHAEEARSLLLKEVKPSMAPTPGPLALPTNAGKAPLPIAKDPEKKP